MTRCMVCDNKPRKAAVDAAIARGLSGVAISRDWQELGWSVSADVINRHKTHSVAPAGVVSPGSRGKRDLAVVVRDLTLEAVEDGIIDITNEKLWKNVNPGLAAQKILDTRASKTDDRKVAFAIGLLLAGGTGGFLAPVALIEGGNVIEGEAREIEDEDVG